MVLKVKQTDRSSNFKTRSREVQLPATHQDDHKCLTNVWPSSLRTFDPCLTTTNRHYIRSKQQSPPPPFSPHFIQLSTHWQKYQKYYFCKTIFNAFTDAATLKEKGIISKQEELLNFSCSCKTTCMKRDNSSVYCKEI